MNYNYDYSYAYDAVDAYETSASIFGGFLAIMGVFYLIMMAVCVFLIVCMWKIFKKAGKQGWESIVPIYNMIVLIEITGLPLWYIALFFVPFANIYAIFKIYIELAHKFGKSTGFGVATVFFSPICIPILAFGSAQYQGGNNEPINNTYNPYQPTNPMPIDGNANNFQQPIMNQPEDSVQQQNTFMFNQEVEKPIENVTPVQPSQPTPTIFDSPMPTQQINQNIVPETTITNTREPNLINPEPTITDIPQANAEQVKYCPNCGNKTAMSADTCFMCGHKF